MVEWDYSIVINAPKQKVWDYLTIPAKTIQWSSSLVSSEWTSEGEPGVGSTLKEVGKVLGRKMESSIEITAWDPPNEIGRKSTGGSFPFEGRLTLESQGNGTQLTVRGTAEVGGFFKMAEGLLAKQIQKQIATEYEDFKRFLEENPG
jgi:carbon monoxide dehydrogenase subunit G